MALQHEQDVHYAETVGQSNELIAGTINAIPMSQPKSTAPVPWGIDHRSGLPKMDGGSIPIEYKESLSRIGI